MKVLGDRFVLNQQPSDVSEREECSRRVDVLFERKARQVQGVVVVRDSAPRRGLASIGEMWDKRG